MNTNPELSKLDPALPAGSPTMASQALLPFDRLLGTMDGSGVRGPELLQFLEEPDHINALATWIDQWRRGHVPASGTELLCMLERDIARIDYHLGQQLDAVLHHPTFQQLEASWRRTPGPDRRRGGRGECEGQGFLGNLGRAGS